MNDEWPQIFSKMNRLGGPLRRDLPVPSGEGLTLGDRSGGLLWVDCRHTSFGMTSMLTKRTFALSPNNDRVATSWRIVMTLPSYAMNQASFPEMYERWLVGPLFRPWAEMTVEELALTPGDRVLDIACGTGIAARVARERLGHAAYVVAIDISPDMLAMARAGKPAIDWREGNASASTVFPRLCEHGPSPKAF